MHGGGVFGQDGRVKPKNPMSRASAGCPGRPRHEIEAILRLLRDSGLSLLAFARQHRLPYPTLWGWRRRPDAMHSPPRTTGWPDGYTQMSHVRM